MNRRQLIGTTLLAGAGLASTALLRPNVGAAADIASAKAAVGQRVLRIVSRSIEVNGRSASVFGLIGSDGKPGLNFVEGERFAVSLKNELADPTIIHWHGLRPPYEQDGVPGEPLPMLGAGETRDYDFPVGAPGTHWMHSHTLQEQNLLAAPLIVRAASDSGRDEQEVVLLLHDFSFTPAEELLARLQKSGGNTMGKHSTGMDHGMADMGAMDMGSMDMGGMNMGGMAMDLNDIDYDAYLVNDRTLDDPEVVTVERSGRIRLRIINGATATVFTIDTGELTATLLAVDGQDVEPVTGRRFPMAMGQRIDLGLSLPADRKSYPILALREGAVEQTGVILAVAGASIAKIPTRAAAPGPQMSLELEGQLRAAKPLAARASDQALKLMLMGNMMTYRWAMMPNGPYKVRSGERVEIAMANHSMMAHPMHLHGHPFQVVAINGSRLAGAKRDTVQIPPMSTVTIAFDADHPGKWAFHCHHLFHMASGMMTFVAYEGFA